MPPARLLLAPVLLLLLVGCDHSDTEDEGLGTIEQIDTSQAGLIAFVKSGAYLSWEAEPSFHASDAPHGGHVRVFFNALAAEALHRRATLLPKGSVLVKELTDSEGRVTGHALDLKVNAEAGAASWLFFEGSKGSDYDNPYYGVAHPTCHKCHSSGLDYARTIPPG